MFVNINQANPFIGSPTEDNWLFSRLRGGVEVCGFFTALGWTNTNLVLCFFGTTIEECISSHYQEIQIANTKVVLVLCKWRALELVLLYQNSENRIVSLTRMSGQELITWNAFNSISILFYQELWNLVLDYRDSRMLAWWGSSKYSIHTVTRIRAIQRKLKL